MKKIAIISRALKMNGATKALVEMLKRIDMTECSVDLWVLDMTDMAEKWVAEMPKTVQICKIPQFSIKIAATEALAHPVAFLKAIRAGRKLRSNIPLCLQWKYTARRLPLLKESYDVAISFRHFDIDVFYVMENMKAKKKYFWIHGIQALLPSEVQTLRPYYEKYDGILPVSKSAKDNFCKYFPQLQQKCVVAYCIVDGKELQQKAEAGICAPVEAGVISIMTIGRLGEEKGIDIAVDAARKLKEMGIHFKWYVAGNGNQRENLSKKIKGYGLENTFLLLGNVENPYGLLSKCNIYVQPSRLESYCLAINEAKIFHKPIICSDIPAGREQIVEGKTGLLFDGTAENLASKIDILCRDEGLREALEKELQKTDWSHFEMVGLFHSLFVE